MVLRHFSGGAHLAMTDTAYFICGTTYFVLIVL